MQQALQARSTIDSVILELEVSSNELVTANNELVRRNEALKLAALDKRTITTRWQAGLSGGQGSNGSDSSSDGVLYLDQLLAAQDRVTAAELDYAESQATAMVAAANLSRARGTLLTDLGYDIFRDTGGGTLLPTYRLVAAAGPAVPSVTEK